MDRDKQEIASKLKILRHAEATGEVARTCRYFGIGRASFYLWTALPLQVDIETFCLDRLQTSIRRQLVAQSAQMGNPHTRTSTAGRPHRPR
jgi:hypothetical protein